VAAIVILVGFAPLLHCDGLQLGRNGNDQICFILFGSVFLNGAVIASDPERKHFRKMNCRSMSRSDKTFYPFLLLLIKVAILFSPNGGLRGVICERVSCPL
jgi:hypothetical protein